MSKCLATSEIQLPRGPPPASQRVEVGFDGSNRLELSDVRSESIGAIPKSWNRNNQNARRSDPLEKLGRHLLTSGSDFVDQPLDLVDGMKIDPIFL
jgi:hypothetical protein